MAVSVAAMLATQGQRWQRGGSRALFVGAQRQLSGSDERGGRTAGHLRQQLQQSGGSGGSTALVVSAQGRWQQCRGGGRVAVAAQRQYVLPMEKTFMDNGGKHN
jgi:hypothetical protein